MVIQSTKSAKVGDEVGMCLDPDGIHIMIAEDHTTRFKVNVGSDYKLTFNDTQFNTDLSKLILGSKIEDGVLKNFAGEEIDISRIRVIASIQPGDIELSDNIDEGLVSGRIINLIYKGDHYSYVVRTEEGYDLIVDDEDLWNMDDQVGLILPEDKLKFTVKR